MTSDDFYDALETRAAGLREDALLAALPQQVAAAQRTRAFAAILTGVDAAAVTSRAALAALPVTRKHELLERQKAGRADPGDGDPFGGFAAIGWRALKRAGARRVFQSPGPIYEPEGHATDYWRFGRALFAAGFRAGDLVHNSFSYHLTPAGAMMEGGAHAIGCTVFPGGVGNTELQLQAMSELRPDAYAGTPSFLRIALEKADETGLPLPSLKKASVGGEAFPPALRDALRARGVEAYQSYGTADLGLVAYETAAREGLVVDEGVRVSDLKGVLLHFVNRFYSSFSAKLDVRLRPSYFPFVEPGVEIDMSCVFCRGAGCRLCKGTGWIEIGGAGMVDPDVFSNVGIDSERYTGFAFGMGIERMAMLRHGVNDIKFYYEGDLRFLDQF